MEKLNDMQNNQIADDELDQVAGGRNIFEVLTLELREFFNKHDNRDNSLGAAKENDFHVSTLEMRVNPLEKQDNAESPKVVKL